MSDIVIHYKPYCSSWHGLFYKTKMFYLSYFFPTLSCVVLSHPALEWAVWMGSHAAWWFQGLSSPSLLWSVLSHKSSVPGFRHTGPRHVGQKRNLKQSCLVWLCLHDWPSSKAVREGRRFNNTHISSFSALRDIVVVSMQLFMAKQEASSFAPSFLCCADSSVWLGHVGNQH